MWSRLVFIMKISMSSRELLWPKVIGLFSGVDKQSSLCTDRFMLALVGSPFCNCLLDFVESSQFRINRIWKNPTQELQFEPSIICVYKLMSSPENGSSVSNTDWDLANHKSLEINIDRNMPHWFEDRSLRKWVNKRETDNLLLVNGNLRSNNGFLVSTWQGWEINATKSVHLRCHKDALGSAPEHHSSAQSGLPHKIKEWYTTNIGYHIHPKTIWLCHHPDLEWWRAL